MMAASASQRLNAQGAIEQVHEVDARKLAQLMHDVKSSFRGPFTRELRDALQVIRGVR